MAKDPAQRFPSAGDLGRAAHAALYGDAPRSAERSVAVGEAAPGSGFVPPPLRADPHAATVVERKRSGGRSALIAAVAGIVLAAAALGAYAALRPKDDTTPPKRKPPAQTLAGCMRAHGLVRAQQKRKPQPGESELTKPAGALFFDQRAYASCSSPPGPGANPDGYSAIVVTEVEGPGESEASGENIADRIEAPCTTVELSYSYGSMGTFERFKPFRARQGQLWSYGAGQNADPPFAAISAADRNLTFYPGRTEIVVLHNGKTILDTVRCVN
jgi:hypothetical protein